MLMRLLGGGTGGVVDEAFIMGGTGVRQVSFLIAH
jgi:hypothetical protein